MSYEKKDSPLQYGILYAEHETKTTETAWYETEEERDLAIVHILNTETLELKTSSSPIGRTVKIQAFSTVDASQKYYQLEQKSNTITNNSEDL